MQLSGKTLTVDKPETVAKHSGGPPVTLDEHKRRLLALANQLETHDFGNNKAGKSVNIAGRVLRSQARGILTHLEEVDHTAQLDVWSSVMKTLGRSENSLKKLHSSKARLFNLKQAHHSIERRHESWAARRLRGWFDAVREKQTKGGPILSVLEGDELVSDPTELAKYVQNFFEE